MKTIDPRTDAGWLQRLRVWKHNSLLGAAGMIKSCALRVLNSDSTTIPAKQCAQEILDLTVHLNRYLKERVDPK